MLRKILISVFLSLFLFPVVMQAGITGVLKGKVVDEEGKPAIGASVKVKGTTRGVIVKDKSGSFILANINAGTYEVEVTYVGYAKHIEKIKISADETTEMNITLKSDRIQTGTVYIDSKKDDTYKKDIIGKEIKIEKGDITAVAREGVAGMVSLSPGVINTGGGFTVRGSRENESQVRIDGNSLGNQFSGGFGSAGTNYFPMVSAYATEEVQVLTGSYSAEYGDAMGGYINTVVKKGRTDNYEGFLRWKTDVGSLYGSSASGLKVYQEGSELRYANTGPGLKMNGEGQNNIEFGFGGPIPLLAGSTFYLSGTNLYEHYLNNNYSNLDPMGNDIGKMPDNSIYKKNITLRTSYAVTNDLKIEVGGMFGMTNYETGSWGWLYSNDNGISGYTSDSTHAPIYNGVPERVAKSPVVNQLVWNAFIKINHTLTPSSYYELQVGTNTNNEDIGKRKSFGAPGFFSGFDIYSPQDKYNSDFNPGYDHTLDQFQINQKNSKFEDGYGGPQLLPAINPLTGYYEGNVNLTGTNNAYGIPLNFYTHGNSYGISYSESKIWEMKGSYSNVFKTGEYDHSFKTGVETQFFTLQRHQNGNPWDSEPFYDVYTDQWGGNIYTDNKTVFEKTSKPFQPYKLGLFAQDQISFKGIVITPGLRFDYFNPKAQYRTNTTQWISIESDSGFATASAKYQISPRLNVAYPITERSNIMISYGMYYQMPNLEYMYNSFNVDILRQGALIGNPNMKAQRSNEYQILYNNQLTDDIGFDLSAYYKDIYDQVGVQYVSITPDPYTQYAVAEYGSSRGLELTFRKRRLPSDHLDININYTLSYAAGTSQNAESNYGLQQDPYTNRILFPLAEYPLSIDRRHRINAVFNFSWQDKEGPSIAGINIFENMTINLSGFWQTGTPYTRLDLQGHPLTEVNGDRQPSVNQFDLRFTKKFYMRDWFGPSSGNSAFSFFIDINNVFNYTAPVAYYAKTGNPDDNGSSLQYRISYFPTIPYYKTADFSNADSYAAIQYDTFGKRLYNANADFDHNGLVTQAESFESFQHLVQTSMNNRPNYRAPRTVYFGLMFEF